MLEPIINFLQNVPWEWVLIVAFGMTILENLFPPAPCDSVIVFTGTLVGLGTVSFVPLLIISTIGSTAGFIIMYYVGLKLGVRIIDSKRFAYINRDTLKKPEELFIKYGDYLIVGNRFLSGTRAVISFFAGITKLSAPRTIILSFISAAIWNSILISAGLMLGKNWHLAQSYIELYGEFFLFVFAAIVLFFIIRFFIKNNGNKEEDYQEK